MSQLFNRLLNNHLVLAIAITVAALIVIGVIVAVIVMMRRRNQSSDEQVQAELMDMEREAQFAAAVNMIPHSRASAQVAGHIADRFGEYLWSKVIAVYAGQKGKDQATNLLAREALTGTPYAAVIPQLISYSMIAQFSWPRVAKLSMITGMRGPVLKTAEDSLATFEAATAQGEPAAFKTGALSAAVDPNVEDVVILPWSGPFDWSGLIVARAKELPSADALSAYREPLAAIGARLAVALELENAESRLGSSSERSVDFSRAVLSAIEEQSPAASLIKEVAALLGSDSAALWRLDPASGMVSMVACHGLKSAEFLPLPLGQGLPGTIVQSGEILALEDAPSDPRCIFPREARESGIASYLGAPLVADGKPIGVVEVHSAQTRSWTEADRRLLQGAAAIVEQLMKSTAERGNRLRVESAYLGLSEALQRLRTPQELMEAAVEVLGHALGVSRALVVELDDKGQIGPVSHEYHAPDASSALGVLPGGPLAEDLITADDGKAIAVTDSTERSMLSPAAAAELQVRSELGVAVKLEGSVRAIICLHQCDRTREWQADETQFLERVARQLALSLMSAHSLEIVSKEAHSAKEAARQSSEANTRVQSLINALPEGVLVLDGESRLNYFNATARDRFGLTNEDVGRVASASETLSSIDAGLWEQVMATQSPTRLEAEVTRAVPGAAGPQAAAAAPKARMHVSLSVSPFRASQGGPIVGRIVVLTDVTHVTGESAEANARIAELENKLKSTDSAFAQARAALSAAQAAEAKAHNEAETARRNEAQAAGDRDSTREELDRSHAAAQQLLETNRLKSDFIMSAGQEIEASLQPVLGITELLGQGQYGPLTPEQQEAIRNIYSWGRRIKSDVDWLIEYGSARSRRLEQSGES